MAYLRVETFYEGPDHALLPAAFAESAAPLRNSVAS